MSAPRQNRTDAQFDVQRILSIGVRGFRNLGALSLTPGPAFNVLHGDNGQGKSNLLEAIDYVCRLSSFRGAKSEELISSDAAEAVITTHFDDEPLAREHRVHLRRAGARTVAVNGKRPRSRASYHLAQQTVLFHSGDMSLTTGGPDKRRAFLDRILQQFDASYGASLAAYEKALRSRNRLLKAERPDRRAIAAYDELMASAGTIIAMSRAQLVKELAPRVQARFLEISEQGLDLVLRYAPRVEPTVEALRAALEHSLSKDLARGFTAEGPHADDLQIELAQTAAKRFASQGQHRAIVLALKISELEELSARVGRVPILLLDDVSSELDRTRNRLLFESLARLGGQVFLTTTHPEFILLSDNRVDFTVVAGRVTPDHVAPDAGA